MVCTKYQAKSDMTLLFPQQNSSLSDHNSTWTWPRSIAMLSVVLVLGVIASSAAFLNDDLGSREFFKIFLLGQGIIHWYFHVDQYCTYIVKITVNYYHHCIYSGLYPTREDILIMYWYSELHIWLHFNKLMHLIFHFLY